MEEQIIIEEHAVNTVIGNHGAGVGLKNGDSEFPPSLSESKVFEAGQGGA